MYTAGSEGGKKKSFDLKPFEIIRQEEKVNV